MVQKDLEKKSENIPWEYTSKAVSPWGGMRMMKELIDKTEVLKKLDGLPLPRPGSNRGYSARDVISSFWVCVWLGGARFAHTSLVRFDEVLKDIFEWKRVPSVSTYTRFFGKFTREQVDNIFPQFNKRFFDKIPIKKLTIDFDSSVVTRYGEQEGSKRGYNPTKKGRPSHHPLIAFVANVRMIANAWMRPGNAGTANNVYNFFEETLKIVNKERIGLVRADSGFYGNRFFCYMEKLKVMYVVAVRVNALMKQQVLDMSGWLSVGDGIHVSEFQYQAKSWKTARRIIVVRQSIERRPKAQGKLLFKNLPGYVDHRYQLFITNLNLEAKMVWDMYRQRADSENRIKELKYDFGMNGFCLHKFYGTEAAFRTVLIAYNLVSLFRQAILKQDTQQHLSTLRFKCFALGSWITKRGRKKVLKLSVVPRRRAWLDGLFSRLVYLSDPFPIKT
jgi:hypothetical protein